MPLDWHKLVLERAISPRLLPVLVVLATVVIQLIAAAALGFAAARDHSLFSLVAGAAISFAVALGGIRFVAWGYLHRHFPLSHVYPLTSLFFPCVLILAVLRGDFVGWLQVIGTLLITAGSFLMAAVKNGKPDNDSLPPVTS